MDADDELDGAAIAEVGIEAVVVGAGDDEMLEVRPPAENLDAVVRAVVDLDVVERGAAADPAQSQALQFVARSDREAGIADLHELQRAAIVVRQGAAVGASRSCPR